MENAGDSTERGSASAGNASGGTGNASGGAENASGGAENASGGWRSQSPWLKVLLAVSLIFVILGIYRCSVELTPVDEPGRVSVSLAVVDVPDGLFSVPADSLAALTTRMFARGLRSSGEADVVVGPDDEAWAVVRLRLGHLERVEEGAGVRLELTAAAATTVGGGRVAGFTGADSPDRLRELTAEAASSVASQLGIASGRNGEVR